MFFFHTLIILILSFTFKKIASRKEEIKLWNITKEYSENVTDFGDDKILSYSWNEKTGAELYLIQSKTNKYFFFKVGSRTQKFSNIYDDLIEIDSPLFLLNSNYYFCSSLPALMYINGNNIEKINNPNEVNDKNSTLKCLRGPDENNILVAFLKTEYLYFFDSSQKKYLCKKNDNGNLLAINYYHDEDGHLYELTILSEIEFNSTYSIQDVKYENNQFHNINTMNREMLLFSKVELSTINYAGVVISFVFTYEPNTEKFRLYRVHLRNSEYYEFRFFYLFKNFKVTFAKYMADNTLLYYSIKSAVPDLNQNYQNYIGVIDIEYNFGLFNIKSDFKEKIYFNNDTYNKIIN